MLQTLVNVDIVAETGDRRKQVKSKDRKSYRR